MQKIYLDNAATTKMDDTVISAINDLNHTVYGNPSSTHQIGRKAKALVENARKNIANNLNCRTSEIIFTSGGTEANNLILFNAVQNLGVKRIITSKIEHHAVLHTANELNKQYNTKIKYVNLNDKGEIDLIHLKKLLSKNNKKTLVSLMLVNNEIGNILDVKTISDLCIENNTLFHSDIVQGIGHLPIDFQNTPIDFASISAHKFHGPKGVGFAVINKRLGLKGMIHGGNQEKGARAGTENIQSIFGMSKALEIATINLEKDKKYINSLKIYFIKNLKENFSKIYFNGLSNDIKKSAYHILNVRFNTDIPMLLFNLDLNGICASGGSACQSGSNKGSHVLHEILSDADTKKSSVRFSFSKFNSIEEIDKVMEVLTNLVKEKKLT